MKSTLSLLVAIALASTAKGNNPSGAFPLFTTPKCEDVWDKDNVPDVADPATMAFIGAVGIHTGAYAIPGDPSSGIPFGNYINNLMTNYLKLGGPQLGQPSTTKPQLACQAFFGTALGVDIQNTFPWAIAAFEHDLAEWQTIYDALNVTGNDAAWYTQSTQFFELRFCPCFNQFPREALEPLNCRLGSVDWSLSEMFHFCHAVDLEEIYEAYPTLSATLPLQPNYGGSASSPVTFDWSRDSSAIANWNGCVTPAAEMWGNRQNDCGCPVQDRQFSNYADAEAFTELTVMPPTEELTGSYLDDTYGNCLPCEGKKNRKKIVKASLASGGSLDQYTVNKVCTRFDNAYYKCTMDSNLCEPCIAKNENPTNSEVDSAMEAFCPDYATDVGVKGKPKYGSSAMMCKQKDYKYEARLHQAMLHGMFGGASGDDRSCESWCLFDVEDSNRHFRWDNKNMCWKTRKSGARTCKDSTNEERGFAADIFRSFCEAD